VRPKRHVTARGRSEKRGKVGREGERGGGQSTGGKKVKKRGRTGGSGPKRIRKGLSDVGGVARRRGGGGGRAPLAGRYVVPKKLRTDSD